ncbi:MAG TPA: FecR domain-containing protein [Pyrinomonadaceae bacterium]|nr:FecR domain-containing protein [Pyrinomonadaceae bacterium]
MFSQHVSRKLSAYCHNELPVEESRLVAEHLIGCQRCRREFEEVKLGIQFAEQLPTTSAPASLWSEMEAALNGRSTAAESARKTSGLAHVFRWWPVAAACAVLLLALVAGTIWYSARRPASPTQTVEKERTQPSETNPGPAQESNPAVAQTTTQNSPAVPGDKPHTGQVVNNNNPKPSESGVGASGQTWEVARLAGAPKLGDNRLEGNGRLAVGEWLETDATSRAKINVADIGQVDIGPNSRVRLLGTRSTEHRLALDRGRLHAMISAPPRLFIVETPSATAIDLGCSYTLEVDDAGRSRLQVTSGWVALVLKGRESIVPAGAVCVTQPGKGPGTPYFDDASQSFRDALTKLDFQNGGAKALNVVLAEAREYDTLTLWHLLARVRGAERGRVYDRLAALIAPPKGVTREGVLKLDKGMLDRWKKGLEWAWFE